VRRFLEAGDSYVTAYGIDVRYLSTGQVTNEAIVAAAQLHPSLHDIDAINIGKEPGFGHACLIVTCFKDHRDRVRWCGCLTAGGENTSRECLEAIA